MTACDLKKSFIQLSYYYYSRLKIIRQIRFTALCIKYQRYCIIFSEVRVSKSLSSGETENCLKRCIRRRGKKDKWTDWVRKKVTNNSDSCICMERATTENEIDAKNLLKARRRSWPENTERTVRIDKAGFQYAWPSGTYAGFGLGGQCPLAAWGQENFEYLTTKWCILKYIWIRMWSA